MKPTWGEDLTAALAPIAELCQHYRAPLLLHTNDPVGPNYPGKAALSLPALYAAIKAFPEVDWILAHWGGGLPFYGLMKKEGPKVLCPGLLRYRRLPLPLPSPNLPPGRRNGGPR